METKEPKTTLDTLQDSLEKVRKEIQEKITNNKFEEAHPLIEIQRYLEKEIEFQSKRIPSTTNRPDKKSELIPFKNLNSQQLKTLATQQSYRRDDLTRIKNIGEVNQNWLKNFGIKTFQDLIDISAEELEKKFKSYQVRITIETIKQWKKGAEEILQKETKK